MKVYLAIGTTLLATSMALPGAFAQGTGRATPPGERSPQPVGDQSPYLGIGVQDIDSQRAAALKLKDVRGAEVTTVNKSRPRGQGRPEGRRRGVLEYNGQAVEGKDQLSRLVRETPVGRKVKIGVWRNGAMQTLTATIEARKGVTVFGGDGNWVMPDVPVPDMRSFRMPDIEIPNFQIYAPHRCSAFRASRFATRSSWPSLRREGRRSGEEREPEFGGRESRHQGR